MEKKYRHMDFFKGDAILINMYKAFMENLIFVHYPVTLLFSSLMVLKRQTQLNDWTTANNTQHPSGATWITCSRFQHGNTLHFFHWHHLCEARFQQLLQDKASTLRKSAWNRKWEDRIEPDSQTGKAVQFPTRCAIPLVTMTVGRMKWKHFVFQFSVNHSVMLDSLQTHGQ